MREYILYILVAAGLVLLGLLIITLIRSKNDSSEDGSDTQRGSENEAVPLSDQDKQSETRQPVVKDITDMNDFEGLDIRDFLYAIMRKLNCQYTWVEARRMKFMYQGENFVLDLFSENEWVRITDTVFYSCPLDHFEEISCMQRAINEVNYCYPWTVFYTIFDDDDSMSFLAKFDLYDPSKMAEPDKFFIECFNWLFAMKRRLFEEFDKEKHKLGLTDN